MTSQECLELQKKLNAMGAGLVEDGIYGPKTKAAEEKYLGKAQPLIPQGETPWMNEAKKHLGKSEYDGKFSAFLSGFWRIVGLPGYKTIKGNSYAWCGLFVAAMLNIAGYQHMKSGAGARNWARFGQEINYKVDGIPYGAIIHINHAHNCKSGSGNHVGFAAGDCTADDVKSGTFNMLGGNQSQKTSVVAYSVKEICEVRWPSESKKPGPVLKSNGCKSKAGSAGSTR